MEEIKRAREAARLTLAEVSRRCGIDQPALSRLENGHNKNPPLDTLWRYPNFRTGSKNTPEKPGSACFFSHYSDQ